MRYQALSSTFYIRNRKNFIKNLSKSSLAILHSNDPMPTNADGTMGFKQNNDLFYLTGIDQEETALIIDELGLEILFIRETSELIKIWEGEKLTKKQATDLSGINDVRWFSEFEEYILTNSINYKNIYFSHNTHVRADSPVETRNTRLANDLKAKLGSTYNYLSLSSIISAQRYLKHQEEINQIQKACDITQKAFERVLKFMKPGVYEFEVEAEITHEFLKNRSRGHAYQPIVASGKNACILHYISNNEKCSPRDLVLLDFGAEYGNYNADLTRTIPVSGKFYPRQKEVYNAVLNVHNFAKTLLVPGNTFEILNHEVAKFMEKELIGLGLITQEDVENQDPKRPAYRKYFMHGTSHSLGLDVHDVDDRTIPFEEGMVFTCEPGIYIPEENLGVRIENNVVLTATGNIDLMENIPITVEEIEDWMNK